MQSNQRPGLIMIVAALLEKLAVNNVAVAAN